MYRWAPLTHPQNPDGFGSQREKIERCRLFCDVYGLSKARREGLITTIIDRLEYLVAFIKSEADSGNDAFKANIADGHHLTYLADINYLKENRKKIQACL